MVLVWCDPDVCLLFGLRVTTRLSCDTMMILVSFALFEIDVCAWFAYLGVSI